MTDISDIMEMGGFQQEDDGSYRHGPKFDIDVQLTGNDGNAYAIFGAVCRGIRKAGGTKEDEDAYMEEAMSGDYDNVLTTSMKYVNVQ